MITIQQKRIFNLGVYLPESLREKDLMIGVAINNITESQVRAIGLSWPPIPGETILPKVIGSVTRFNAKGKEIPQKHLPKETHYRDFEYTRKEWHGQDQVEVTDFRWIPYAKYPREIILPLGIEVTVDGDGDTAKGIFSGPFQHSEVGSTKLLHAINMYLEMFGTCSIYDQSLNPINLPKRVNLRWEVLPKGRMPWPDLRNAIEVRLEKQPPKSKAAALRRFEMISELQPDFYAVGQGGFGGYVVFGFSDKDRYVLECQQPNNAIYVFDGNWEELSQLTKAEILNASSHEARIIHTPRWYERLRSVLH